MTYSALSMEPWLQFFAAPEMLLSYLKGQCHEKVGEMRVQGDSLDPN
jgi:hypothetical protein